MFANDRPLAKIAAALAAAQAELHGPTKDATNPHFKSKYADLANVVEACRPLNRPGIAILQPVRADGAQVTVTTLLLHSSGEWLSADLTMTAKDASPQAIGSAITYGRRYALLAMVGLAPEDDDGEAAQGRDRLPVKATTAPLPAGYGEWWAQLQTVADRGTEALQKAFYAAPNDLRKALTERHLPQWEALKAKAAKGKALAVAS